MASLSSETIGTLVAPFYPSPGADLLDALAAYLDLLMRWNVHTNLTAIRDPATVVARHFGESLFASQHVPSSGSLLDFGSGAGFPGVPIALARRGLSVTLAESQNKKASFLREAVRVLGLSTQVWPSRVEAMRPGLRFDYVTMRAVDRMPSAMVAAGERASSALLVLTTAGAEQDGLEVDGLTLRRSLPIPFSERRILSVFERE